MFIFSRDRGSLVPKFSRLLTSHGLKTTANKIKLVDKAGLGKSERKKVLTRKKVFEKSFFSFDGRYFKQINDVAMGTKMGPSYAN